MEDEEEVEVREEVREENIEEEIEEVMEEEEDDNTEDEGWESAEMRRWWWTIRALGGPIRITTVRMLRFFDLFDNT
ncbi:hypothetical protein GDO81_014781 [Engystomops pustulosus]|uniref:Uncharacterized protein n=2 Tax=Engystomops pustulosus TaxID=76066 RepID=A0AAV7AIZ8_ENGPU|nr:hypothetical protein GDO81_014781 [Engystomops pustulosus]